MMILLTITRPGFLHPRAWWVYVLCMYGTYLDFHLKERFSMQNWPLTTTKMAMVKISHQSFTESEELGEFGDCYESFRTHN